MLLLEEHKKDINKSLQEIEGNMNKVEALTMETQKSLKVIQENKGQEIEANKEERQKKKIKEMEENLSQQAEVISKETQKSLKELKENTNK